MRGSKTIDFSQREYLNLKHASLFLDMPISTLRKRYMSGQIKYIQDPYSKRIYFSKKELVRYMQRWEQKNIAINLPDIESRLRIAA
jgi:hypothetical protein